MNNIVFGTSGFPHNGTSGVGFISLDQPRSPGGRTLALNGVLPASPMSSGLLYGALAAGVTALACRKKKRLEYSALAGLGVGAAAAYFQFPTP